MDPALVSASFVGLAGLVGVLIGFVFVYKGFNRKHILLFSAIGTALAFIGLGIRGVIQSDPNGKYLLGKVENILEGSLDLMPSPSPSVEIQIMGGKVCLRCKGKTLLGIVNKLFVFKSLPLHLNQTFLHII